MFREGQVSSARRGHDVVPGPVGDHAAIKREFGWFLSGEEQLQLLERRDTILEYLDRLVAERGYDEVVIH